MQLTDIVDPASFQRFVESNLNTQFSHEQLLHAEAAVLPLSHAIEHSNTAGVHSCPCTLGTLLALDLYLQSVRTN
jgi:hypothetical protein